MDSWDTHTITDQYSTAHRPTVRRFWPYGRRELRDVWRLLLGKEDGWKDGWTSNVSWLFGTSLFMGIKGPTILTFSAVISPSGGDAWMGRQIKEKEIAEKEVQNLLCSYLYCNNYISRRYLAIFFYIVILAYLILDKLTSSGGIFSSSGGNCKLTTVYSREKKNVS